MFSCVPSALLLIGYSWSLSVSAYMKPQEVGSTAKHRSGIVELMNGRSYDEDINAFFMERCIINTFMRDLYKGLMSYVLMN